MEYSVVIVAAGTGSRMHLGYNKVYYRLDDETILEKSIRVFDGDERCKEIIVVSETEVFEEEVGYEISPKLICVPGGQTRQESVRKGLEQIHYDFVLIHDGARPFITKEVIDRVIEGLKDYQAVCPVVPVKDTIRMVDEDGMMKTLDRDKLYGAQTPQGFSTKLIKDCLTKVSEEGKIVSDDIMAVELYSSTKIHMVEGDYQNQKITTQEDLIYQPH